MHPDQLKTAVRDITMPDTMQQRILHNVQAAAKPKRSAPRRRASLRKRPLAVALAALLCLTLAVPALAANVSPLYELLYRISPAVAQAFQPVQYADEDNGIRMEVVAATLHGPTAELYVTLQDLQGDRVDETTDFNDSYTLYTPFDSTAHCVPVGYDAQTRTAAFLITISQQNGKDIDGGKITFSAKNFLSRKSAYEGLEIPVDWAAVPANAETRPVSVSGGTTSETTFQAMVPAPAQKDFPVPGVDWNGLAWVDGKLHLQIAILHRAKNDNHGFFYLIDPVGNCLNSDLFYFVTEDTSDAALSYIEYVFSVPSKDLSGYTLYGDLYTAGLLTEGNWKVTFSLQDAT